MGGEGSLAWRVPLTGLCLILVAGAIGCGGGGSSPTLSSSSASAPSDAGSFDAGRALELAERQVAAGQRPAGSAPLRKLALELRPLLPGATLEPIPGEPRLRNIVGSLPGRKPAIVLGAHYDTLAKPRGFVGANNGAAGTAVVIEAARALQHIARGPKPREVRFVLFDGEEPPNVLPEEAPNFYKEGLRGSKAYVAAHSGETQKMILVDYVGNKGLYLPREGNSAKGLWSRLLGAAKAAGTARYFSAKTGAGVYDDHIPFLFNGVPAIDLIDWSYSGHSLSDRLDKLSRSSLAAVGETVVGLIDELQHE